MAPRHGIGSAALLCCALAGCMQTPARRYQVTRESQLRAVARDLAAGIASLPHGMVLHELSEPLAAGAGEDRPELAGVD